MLRAGRDANASGLGPSAGISLAAGADGYVLKRSGRLDLLRAVRTVADGRSVLAVLDGVSDASFVGTRQVTTVDDRGRVRWLTF